MAGRFPGADSIDQLWQNLTSGNETLTTLTDEQLKAAGISEELIRDPSYVKVRGLINNPEEFDAAFFGYRPREAELMDPQHRIFLETCWQAIEMTGYAPSKCPGNVGVWGGMSTGMTNNTYLLNNLHSHPDILEEEDILPAMLGNENDYLTTRVSHKLNLRGPSVNVQCACSTSLVAITTAYQSLMTYGSDMALAGGVSVSYPQHEGYLYQEGDIGAPDGHCRPFDSEAQGTVFSNGVGIVVLKRLEDAIEDGDTIYALIRGAAINNDGAEKVSFAAPSVNGQADVIATAQAIAGVEPETVTYVECHGTGTNIGDPIEVAGLIDAFSRGTDKTGFCGLGSIKSNFGHLDSAAGVTSFIKTVLCLHHKTLVPTLHYKSANPKIDFANSPFYVCDKTVPWEVEGFPRRAGVSGFGIGGTNAHIVLEEAGEYAASNAQKSDVEEESQLLLISAKTAPALKDAVVQLGSFLGSSKNVDFANIAYTLRVGRESFSHRACIVAKSPKNAAQVLSKFDRTKFSLGQAKSAEASIVFMFPGGGAQYVNMGYGLYEAEPEFAKWLDRGVSLHKERTGFDLRTIWFASNEEAAEQEFIRPSMQLPAIFIIEIALAKLWQSKGIEPSALIGHSVGENTAACLSGVMSFEDALGLVSLRGQLFETVKPGGMLSVTLSVDELSSYLNDDLDLATINGPNQCTVAGQSDALKALEKKLEHDGVDVQVIPIAIAAHSHLLEPILNEFGNYLRSIKLKPPGIPFISNLTGDWISDVDAQDPEYWVRHLRNTVQFSDGVMKLLTDDKHIFIEVGPGKILGSLVKLHQADAASRVVSTLRHPREEITDSYFLLNTVGKLWVSGYPVNWSDWIHNEARQRLSLPTYPFQGKKYFVEPSVRSSQFVQEKARANLQHADAGQVGLQTLAASTLEQMEMINARMAGQSKELQSPFQHSTQNNPNENLSNSGLSNRAPDTEQRSISAMSRKDLIQKKLTDIIQDLSGLDPTEIDPNASFLDMGFDSLFLTQANLKFKKVFKVKITFRQLFDDAPNINALAEFIDGKLPADALQVELSAKVAVESIPVQAATPPNMVAPVHSVALELPSIPNLQGGQNGALQQAIALQIQASNLILSMLGGGNVVPASTPQIPVSQTAPSQTTENHSANSLTSSATESVTNPKLDGAEKKEPRTHTQVKDSAAKSLGPYKPLDTSSGGLSVDARKSLDEFIVAYSERTAGSKKLANDQRGVLADARSISGFRKDWKEIVYQIAASKGSKGSRVWDLDGNEYIDITSGFGINLFGYSPDWITKAAKDQLDAGIELGTISPLAYESAQLISELTGMDRSTFTNTGSEAISAAVRAARTTTGKDKIAVFYDEYHGISDEVLVNYITVNGKRKTVPTSPGIPQFLVDNVIVLEYSDPNYLDIIKEHADDLAAVIIEPVQNRNPSFKSNEFFSDIRKVTKDNDIAMIFDEMITGFRLAPGGAQEYFGIEVDMVCYGKIVSGGMPLAVVSGRGEFLDCFDGGPWQFGDDSFPEAGVTFFGGTYTRHPIALATSVAALKHIKSIGKPAYEELNRRSRRFAHQLNEIIVSLGFPARIENRESIFNLRFNDDNPFSRLIHFYLKYNGVLIYDRPFFVSMAHSDEDFEFIKAAFKKSIIQLQESGVVPSTSVDGQSGEPRVIPFSDAHIEIWLATQLGEDASRAFHEQVIYEMDGMFNIDALRYAVQKVVYRHEGLRANVDRSENGLIILPARYVPVTEKDLSHIKDEAALQAAFEDYLVEHLDQDYDLFKDPLVRFSVVKLSENRSCLVLAAHHLVIDGWSMGVVLKDLSEYYNSACRQDRFGEASPFQLSSFLEEVKGYPESEEYKDTEAFWLNRFADGVPNPPQLPLDYPRPSLKTYNGRRVCASFDKSLSKAIYQYSNDQNCTLFTTLFSMFSILVNKLTGQNDLVIGVPVAGQAVWGQPDLVGHCVNFLPFRIKLNAQSQVGEFVGQMRAMVLDGNEYQNFTFGSLLPKLKIKRDPSQMPLTSLIFNVDQGMDVFDFDGSEARYLPCPRDYVKYDIFFNIIDESNHLSLELDYNSDLFDLESVEHWIDMFMGLAKNIVSGTKEKISTLLIAQGEEKWHVLQDWNDTDVDYDLENVDLAKLFEKSVDKNPDAIALEFESQQLSYRQLDDQANQYAQYLSSKGIGRNDVVALLMDRSIEMVVALYGIQKAGAVYLPLDPGYPDIRLHFILEESKPKLVLSDSLYVSKIPTGINYIVPGSANELSTQSTARLNVQIKPDDLAYIIYTSGSTGKPKGVMTEQRSICNRLLWMNEKFSIGCNDVVLQKTPYGFDVSLWELFCPLFAGAKLVVAKPNMHQDPEYLIKTINNKVVTAVHFVPSMLQLYLMHPDAGKVPSLKWLFCSGEALGAKLVEKCYSILGEVEVHNFYGPTEAAVDVSHWHCRRDASGYAIPIGRPIANTQIYVLDELMQPVPVGVKGELYIGGVQVARGYLNREEITCERFIDDPFLAEKGNKLYKTGDIARYRSDGVIEYFGRNDFQVKVRGLRIELGEIESVLLGHEGITQAVVVTKEDKNGTVIVAYLVSSNVKPGTMNLRNYLGTQLPAYMIPQYFVFIDAVPLTSSGKSDRNQLIQIEHVSREIHQQVDEPKSPDELYLSGLWLEFLGEEDVFLSDNFFDIGGHSMLAIRIRARIIEERGIDVPLRVFITSTMGQIIETYFSKESAANTTQVSDSDNVVKDEQKKRGSLIKKLLNSKFR
jgi:amino acid adenylation domain-containing protein